MDGYKHYVRLNEHGTIICGFSSAFEQPIDGDVCVQENGSRHFHLEWAEPLINERGQYVFKWVDSKRTERTQKELDAEWSQRPPEPPTTEEKVQKLDKDSIDSMVALTVCYELVLQLQARIHQLESVGG